MHCDGLHQQTRWSLRSPIRCTQFRGLNCNRACKPLQTYVCIHCIHACLRKGVGNKPTAHHGKALSGLDNEREKFSRPGLSSPVIQTIQAARMGVTTTCHRAKWLGFQCWREEWNLDPCLVQSGQCFPFYNVWWTGDWCAPLFKCILQPFLLAKKDLVTDASSAPQVAPECCT